MFKVGGLVLEKGLRAEFMKAYDTSSEASDHLNLMMKVNSSAASEKYGWLGAINWSSIGVI